ncbi:phosphotransferase system HPr (HPr) family protein [Hoeflea sp. IMCC20628]|uniref:HPr family phosphocarrier protein n=1 Tax=Hoeflea sp. IMCC20628 TaxID=1620421 RepID=UPI00063ACD6C|nr:HPr family phosphocarrier protein [Hoeflea sp. IMCC20628]AKI02872.1 phosphotransferase system HPr (HPr) family protein [Hoeflea sp. IMCC20628]
MTADSLLKTRTLEIVNKRGLHARASARFVQTVEGYDAAVKVTREGSTVGGTSIMGLMMLAASPGCSIVVQAGGRQADEVLDALEALIANRFGEEA